MKNIFFGIILFAFSCQNLIKNEDAKVENEVKVDTASSLFSGFKTETNEKDTSTPLKSRSDLIGNWVGWFEPELDEEQEEKLYKKMSSGEADFWNRQNKINIAITKLTGDSIYGHSVVAGNDRPFRGILIENDNEIEIKLTEPGDNKYDGKFQCKIRIGDSKLIGNWDAFGKIDISKRTFKLSKEFFSYDPNLMIDSNDYFEFVDWEAKMGKIKDDEEFEEMDGYVTSTNMIYKVNASTQIISDNQAKEMTKGDLAIIRNMIYARHGYSFKRRPLRTFFDSQKWYLPLSADITKELTELEKKNIQILLKYEKNAKAYYEYFGR